MQFNTLLILGSSALFVPLVIDKNMKRYDIPIMVAIYALLIVFSFVITPYVLTVLEGIIFALLFIGYLVFLVLRAKKDKTVQVEPEKEQKKRPIWLSIILVVLGIAGIIFGGNFVVNNASEIALVLGMSEALVGLTIVSIGTSLPELVTSIVAAVKKENDIAIGNVVGSNIFNVIFILGTTSIISPLIINPITLVDMIVMAATGVITLLIALCSKKLYKWQGILMMLAYVGYVAYIIIRN